MNSIDKARIDFPLLSQRVKGKKITYLDSAATALKPWPVIERLTRFYSFESANVHRGSYYLSDQATESFEQVRTKVQKFINASFKEEIIFTKGTTESINLIATTFGETFLEEGDSVLSSIMEHHANFVPWQNLCKKRKAQFVVVDITDQGEIDLFDFEEKLNHYKPKLVAITQCSNALGTINPVRDMISMAHKVGAKVLVDGAQIVANEAVDVQKLDADFFVFSSHKVFGPFGVGILYGKKELLSQLPPYQFGGSMISHVSVKETTFQDLPFCFEAGTPNIGGVLATQSAIEYLEKWDWEHVQQHETKLIQFAREQILKIPGIRIYGQAQHRGPILSFILEGCHPSDVGQILDEQNIAVRAGHHCAQPLMARLKIPGTVRASFSLYNNEEDVSNFINALNKAKEILL